MKGMYILLVTILMIGLSSGALQIKSPNNSTNKVINLKSASQILFSQITGTDKNGCSIGDFVTNVSFINGDLQIVCGTPSGAGDITSVIAGTGLFGGGLTGDVTLNISASTCSAGEVSKYNGTGFVCVTDSGTTYSAGSNLSLIGTTFSLNATSLKQWLDTIYQAIGNYLLVSDLPLTNRTISHWDNVTNKPANLDTDSTNDLLITDLPLHNRTLVNCLNITGATSNLCTITSSGVDGTGSWTNDSIQTNTSVNVNILTGHNITSNWFKGLFNWTTLNNWLSFDGATLSFNETKLNNSIDARTTKLINSTNVAYLNNTQTFTLNQNFSGNITVNQRTCYDATCSQYIYSNGSALIIQG